MNWQHLLEIAMFLATASLGAETGGRPRQANLRRALSTAYYAMFNALANSNANTLVGAANSVVRTPEWTAAYRAMNHGQAKSQMSNSKAMSRFHNHIREFGDHFVNLQAQRLEADYNPNPGRAFTRSETVRYIRLAELLTRRFLQAPEQERRAFAAYLLFPRRT